MLVTKRLKTNTNNQMHNITEEQLKNIAFLQSDSDKQASLPEVPKKTAFVKHEILDESEQEQPDIS